MFNFLFKKQNQKEDHFKKWVVVTFLLILPVLFGFWGVFLSQASYKLSLKMDANREQIDTLTSMMKKLNVEISLLEKSVAIQDSQFQVYKEQVKNANKPNLKAELFGSDLGKLANLDFKIYNSGGNISNLIFIPLNGAKISTNRISKNKRIPSGASYDIRLSNVKDGVCLRLIFTDGLMNKYSQDLSWISDTEAFEFGKLQEIKNN